MTDTPFCYGIGDTQCDASLERYRVEPYYSKRAGQITKAPPAYPGDIAADPLKKNHGVYCHRHAEMAAANIRKHLGGARAR